MGAYYVAANDTKKQYLDPGEVGNGGIKRTGVVQGDFARLLVWIMLDDWYGDRVEMVADTGTKYDDVHEKYENVTQAAVEAYNREFDPPLYYEKITAERI